MYKLLIIEDDIELALTIRNALKIKGFNSQIIADGRKGLMYALRNRFDLIILDFNLPSLDGIEVLVRLRSRGKEVPILILTGNAEERILIDGLAKGADDFMVKPFKMNELEARLRRFLTRPPVTRIPYIEAGGIKYQKIDKYVMLEGITNMDMSKRESELLAYLLLHRNSLVSRETLLTNVWGDKPDLKSNTVDCYISSVRKKLSCRARSIRLETIHGFGYKLSV